MQFLDIQAVCYTDLDFKVSTHIFMVRTIRKHPKYGSLIFTMQHLWVFRFLQMHEQPSFHEVIQNILRDEQLQV